MIKALHPKYTAEPTGDTAIHSGRPRYRIECNWCKTLLHENTTGLLARINQHEADGCAGAPTSSRPDLQRAATRLVQELHDGIFEELREVWGNTNVAVWKTMLADLRTALSTDDPRAARLQRAAMRLAQADVRFEDTQAEFHAAETATAAKRLLAVCKDAGRERIAALAEYRAALADAPESKEDPRE